MAKTAKTTTAKTTTAKTTKPQHPSFLWPTLGLGFVFLIKLIVLAQLKDHPLLQPDAGLDTTAYVDLAKRVVGGDVGLGPGLYYVSPFYVYFLAIAYGLTRSFTAVRVFQVVLGTATVALVFVMAREWFGRRAAWIAAGVAAVCGVMTFYEVLILQSAVDGILTACALCALTVALHGRVGSRNVRDTVWFAIAGVVFGLQTLNRPNVLLPAVALVAILLLVRRLRPAVWLAAGLAIGLAPVAIRNVAVSHEWSLVSSHGGLNFYIGNHDGATGFYEFVPGVRPGIEGQRDDTRRVAEAAVGHALSDAEVSDYFFNLGASWMRAHPRSAVALLARKFLYVFHADHLPLPSSYEFFAVDANTALRWLVANPWLIVPLGIVGFIFARPRDHAVEFLVWASFVPLYAAAVAVFFVAERYRLPMFVPLLVGTGALVDRGLQAVVLPAEASRRWLAAAGASTVVALGLVQWPLALSDSREGDRIRMAMRAIESGRFDEGERWANLAVRASTAPAVVQATIGHGLVGANQPARALTYLRAASANGSADPQVLVDLSSALKGTGDNAAAIAQLRSIDFPKGSDPKVRLEAGRLAERIGESELAERLFRDVVRDEPGSADAWAQLGFAELVRNETSEAAAALAEAVRLNPKDPVALGGLAVCELNLGRRDDALAHATRALSIDPHETLAAQALAAVKPAR